MYVAHISIQSSKVYTKPDDRGLKSDGVLASQYRVYVEPTEAVLLVTEPIKEDELEMVGTKMVLFAAGQADRGTKVGVDSAVVDADVVVVADFATVGLGPEAPIVRTPLGGCDVDVLQDM